jgi:NAD(P)-dependent dehydrogenase (short-subunit alcohol dehydrogenase family)
MPGRRSSQKAALTGHVALVAGATRGAGRGIARALGEAGAVVYCTGRSVRGQPSPYNRPETIDETAEMIAAAGGTAIALRVDHTVEAEVEALIARIDKERGRLDILVNCVAGEDPMMKPSGFFWTTNLTAAEAVFRQAVLSHIIAAKHAVPLMIRRRSGLIVEVTEGHVLSAGSNPISQTVKLAHKGLALNMAAELKPHGVAAVAITPGFLRSEAMLEHFGVTEANWRDGAKQDNNFLESESPLFVGRAVAALAGDPNIMERTGQLFSSWEVGREFKLTDADGRRPDWGAADLDFSIHPEWLVTYIRNATEIQLEWISRLTTRTKQFLKQLPKARGTRKQPMRSKRQRH